MRTPRRKERCRFRIPQIAEQLADYEKLRALFSRALAELKYMGMIKNSRRKADHLAKLQWNGL